MSGEGEHGEHGDEAGDEREIEQRRERMVAQREPAIGGLRHLQLAEHAAWLPGVNRRACLDHAVLPRADQHASGTAARENSRLGGSAATAGVLA